MQAKDIKTGEFYRFKNGGCYRVLAVHSCRIGTEVTSGVNAVEVDPNNPDTNRDKPGQYSVREVDAPWDVYEAQRKQKADKLAQDQAAHVELEALAAAIGDGCKVGWDGKSILVPVARAREILEALGRPCDHSAPGQCVAACFGPATGEGDA